jgi:hypothetical protein
VRTPTDGGILAADTDTAGRLVAVEILLRVRRGTGDRLDGSACISDGTEVREFSGMLELMRVFEELVPVQQPPREADAGDPSPNGPPPGFSEPGSAQH